MKNGSLKIIDFGEAEIYKGDADRQCLIQKGIGTPHYWAPEIKQINEDDYGLVVGCPLACDIFALGKSLEDMIGTATCGPNIKDIMNRMLSESHRTRLSVLDDASDVPISLLRVTKEENDYERSN